MRVLVTGGLGYLGRAVAIQLTAAGHAVDVLTSGDGQAEPPPGSRIVACDLRDPRQVWRAFQDHPYDGVCHLAALTRGRESFAEALRYWDVNVGGTLNLLNAVERSRAGLDQGFCRMVFASSSVVYGSRAEGTLSESLPVAPESPYGHTKVAAERVLCDVASTGLIGATILRVFNVGGCVDGRLDRDPTRILPNLLRVAIGERQSIEVNGDGSAVREFAHVADVARAFGLALEATQASRAATLNIGSGRGTSVADLIATVEKVTQRRIPVIHRPPQREPQVLVADVSAARRHLGWTAERSSLEEIIGSAWAAAVDRGGVDR